jgi:hypothetical protein
MELLFAFGLHLDAVRFPPWVFYMGLADVGGPACWWQTLPCTFSASFRLPPCSGTITKRGKETKIQLFQKAMFVSE